MQQPKWNDYKVSFQKIIQNNPYTKLRKTVSWLAWSCDGQKLATCGYEKAVRLWTPERSTELRSTASLSGGHTEHIDQVAWSPVHKDLLCSSSSEDKRVCFWDARQSKVVQSIRMEGSPWQIGFAPDGKTLLIVGNDSRAIFLLEHGKREEDAKETWNRIDTPKHSIEQGNASIMDFCWLNSGTAIAAGCTDGSLKILEYPSLQLLHSNLSHFGQCNSLGQHPRGNYIATGGNDAILGIWDMQEWMCVRTCSPYDETVNWLRFSYDGEWIAGVWARQKEITLINFEMGEVGHRIKTSGEVNGLAWHPSKLLLASCGDDEDKTTVGWVSFFTPPS
ncbi:hypothetical protein M408DRAFT_220591 [Serendipita vermifera MAFF 305830]|uniref:Uncharacterized protein n=1 Tax=Serendipita vermifera MAFF 305830 TaxID=933852 RepID=A0A0C3AKR6_SERVB|nr:hypothetical protein M408DRAFT_220591 [Serendipita vermifera MAFF 305830]